MSRLTLRQTIVPVYLLGCLLLGGASAAGDIANLALQLAALPLGMRRWLAARLGGAGPGTASAAPSLRRQRAAEQLACELGRGREVLAAQRSSAQEVPNNGSTATGNGLLNFDATTKKITGRVTLNTELRLV